MARVAVLLLSLSALCVAAAPAQVELIESRRPSNRNSSLVVPFAFRTDSLDFAYGLGGGATDLGQNGTRLAAAVLASTNDSRAGFATFSGLRLGSRWYLDGLGSVGRFTRLRTYGDVGDGRTPRPGSNESGEFDFLQGPGTDSWFDARLTYVLPVLRGRREPLQRVQLVDGLVTGERAERGGWPGFLRAELRPYVRDFGFDAGGRDVDLDMAALGFSLTYDATDMPFDPGRGLQQRLTVLQGFDVWGDTDTFTVLASDTVGYVPIDGVPWMRRTVLALEAWTADTPSWATADGRPPPYEGARLGGFFRLRGFDVNRFHDRAALHLASELRLTPEWNPFRAWRQESYAIDWLQFAAFVEAGRVAPRWSPEELLTDMRVSAGVGVRALALGAVVRLDVAFSEEDFGVWVMVGQPTFVR